MTQFPSDTTIVYVIFEYSDMAGEATKIRVYDNYGSILFEQTESYTGSGAESVATTTSEGYFPDSRYVTNFYSGEYVSRTIIWNVGEPVAKPVATPTTTPPTAKIYDQVKDFAVPAAAILLIILVAWAIYRVLTAR